MVEIEYIPTEVNLSLGSEGEEVERLQKFLKQYGYLKATDEEAGSYAPLLSASRSPEAEMGKFDEATVMGLRRFQKFYGLPVTGELDEATLAMMSQPRCGFPDVPQGGVEESVAGGLETADSGGYTKQGNKWNKQQLTYGFKSFSNDLSNAEVRSAIEAAANHWSEATPLEFSETSASNADIVIRFVTGNHGDGNGFDGPGGVLAHGYYPPPNGGSIAGDIHFDDAENWTVGTPVPSGGTDLITVAAHEFGHALGLKHSSENGALMFPTYGGPHRHLEGDDCLAIQSIYGANVRDVPGWFGWENQGADIAIADVNGNGRPDLLVFHVDNPKYDNQGHYRIGWNLDQHGEVTDGWTDTKGVPGWFGWENQGGGIAMGDIDGSGHPDLVVFHVDNPSKDNHGFYRIGRNIDQSGDPMDGWTDVKKVPGWFGWENQGSAISLADLTGNGQQDLIVFHLDNPEGDNHGYYRVGWNLDGDGNPTGGWSGVKKVPGWFGWENQGAGIAVADVDGNGQRDLLVFHVDNPNYDNHGFYRIGRNLDSNGDVQGGWGDVVKVPGWFGWENQGAGVATADINGTGEQDLVVFHVDNPNKDNHGFYRVITDL